MKNSKRGGIGKGGGNGRGRGDIKEGGRVNDREQTFKISKISEMYIMVTTQTTATLVGFHLTTPSSSTKVMLVVVLID